MLCAAYIVPHTGLALMLLGGFEAEAAAILMYTAISLATICVFASLCVLVAMLCPNTRCIRRNYASCSRLRCCSQGCT